MFRRSVTGCGPRIDRVAARGDALAAERADGRVRASTPASSVNSSSRVPVDQPDPLASMASTMPVVEAVISVDSSVWTSGRCVDAMATRSWTIGDVAAEDQTQASSSSSLPASSARRRDAVKVRRAPVTTCQPASTRSRVVEIEEPRVVVGAERPPLGPGAGQGDEGRIVHRGGARLRQRAPHPIGRQVGRLRPEAESRAVAPRKTTWRPMPWDSVDFGSSTPLEGMCEV